MANISEETIHNLYGDIRDATEIALNTALPDANQDSLAYIKLKMFMRLSLMSESKEYISEMGDVDQIIFELKPLLVEELLNMGQSAAMDERLAIELMSYLEKEISFPMIRDVLNELMPDNKMKRFEVAGTLLQTGSDELRRRLVHSSGIDFPEGYPYMDEFEYIDSL